MLSFVLSIITEYVKRPGGAINMCHRIMAVMKILDQIADIVANILVVTIF